VNLALVAAAGRLSDRSLAVAASLAAAGVSGLSLLVSDFSSLLPMALLVGGTVAAMGTVCNFLVVEGTPHALRGRALAGLHTMYGIGSFGAGLVVSGAIDGGIGWRWLFLGLAPLHLLMALFFAWRLPARTAADPDGGNGLGKLDRRHILVLVVFVLYVGGEVTTSMWLSNFLVGAREVEPAAAAQRVSGFFAVLTVSRIVCWFFVRPSHERGLLIASLLVPLVSFVVGYAAFDWAFALVGLVGPFFPVYLARVSREFGRSWKTLTMWIFLGDQIGLATINLALGRAADLWDIQRAFLAPPLMLAAALALVCLHLALAARPGWVEVAK
jgi:fucose permease